MAKHPKFTPPSKTTSIAIFFKWESSSPRGGITFRDHYPADVKLYLFHTPRENGEGGGGREEDLVNMRTQLVHNYSETMTNDEFTAGILLKAGLRLDIGLVHISCLRFKQSRISPLIT